MTRRIKISVMDISISAQLWDTPTSDKILKSLPLKGTTNIWGDEIYFMIPMTIDLEPEARADVDIGELGYWPTGSAFCVFFGPTPMSRGDKPVAASAVNVFGRIEGDCSLLRSVPDGVSIIVEKE